MMASGGGVSIVKRATNAEETSRLGGRVTNADTAGQRTWVRYYIIAFIFIVTSLNYADRSVFSIAGASAAQDLGLSAMDMGVIMSAFGWAYALAQIPGGGLL